MVKFRAGDEVMRNKALRKGKTAVNMLWKPPESIGEALQAKAPQPIPVKVTDKAISEVAVEAELCKQFSNQIRRGGKDKDGAPQSFADLLSDMYGIGADLVNDLKERADPSAIKDRAEAFKSVARALPMLQAAESNARGLISNSTGDGKKVEDMTHAELRAMAKQIVDAGEGA
jgi:hypothetical protein